MAMWTIAKKEWRLLLRDPRAGIILLAMPFIFILVLGLSLGEGFGQKPDERMRVSLVDLDQGYVEPVTAVKEIMGRFVQTPAPGGTPSVPDPHALAALALAGAQQTTRFPSETWAQVVQRDLAETAGIRVEVIPTREEAERLVTSSKRAAVLVFGPDFSKRVHSSSFLAVGLNPFYRDGVKLSELDAHLLRDPTQLTAASISEQVAQVSLLRVILPWMIGRAFEKLGQPSFMSMLAEEVPGGKLLPPQIKASLGSGVQGALKRLFPKYDLTGKTWAALTKSQPKTEGGAEATVYQEDGLGPLKRGAIRYQLLVPSYTVMFAFFLVLTVGWLFVSERRQGTLKRLRAAPLTRSQILLGKLLPCFVLSFCQAAFLLAAGKLAFGMKWGPEQWSLAKQALLLLPVILASSWAAMGLALLVASLARTETQVAIYGTLLVLVLAGISGCLMPSELMPELMRQISLSTPQGWALDAYKQLLLNPSPDLRRVGEGCLVLFGFGSGFLVLAWSFLRLD
jgi:ABC-type transport system involved in multi-copper enzyme maturation permease subunit